MRRALRFAVTLAAASVTVLAAGCAHDPANEAGLAVLQNQPVSDELALGPGDTFEVRVYGEPDLSGPYRVGPDGTVDYPLIGQVHVDGLDAHRLSAELTKRLGDGYLRRPQVSVTIKDQSSKKILVIGHVSEPGTFAFVPNMTILEAIAGAGGFTPIAWKDRVTISRVHDGQKFAIEVPVAKILEGKARNVPLRPGDSIYVPERPF